MNRQKEEAVIEFTGERMVPDQNKGMTLYYEHLLRYLMAAEFTKGKTVLDVGCGVGYGAWLLSKNGAKDVLGIDNSDEAIAYASKKFATSGLKFATGDGENLKDYGRKVGVVTAFEFIEHIKNQKRFLEGVKVNLKKGGLFFVSSPNKNTYQNHNHFHINELTPREFEKLLKQFFTNVLIFDQRFLFTNYIIPTHDKNSINLEKMDDGFVKEPVDAILPVNQIEDSRYMVAICSDEKIEMKKYFSLSSFTVDNFSLIDGVEGMYADWNSKNKISGEELDLLNQIRDSWFFKLWQFYCLLKGFIRR